MQTQHQRPESVTVIASLLLMQAALGIFYFFVLLRKPDAMEKPELLYTVAGGVVACALIGWLMFKGVNWARILFFVVYVPSAVTAMVLLTVNERNPRSFAAIVPLVAACGFLLAPASGRFFTGQDKRKPHDEETTDSAEPPPRPGSYDY